LTRHRLAPAHNLRLCTDVDNPDEDRATPNTGHNHMITNHVAKPGPQETI
jgi:hypothetical protein